MDVSGGEEWGFVECFLEGRLVVISIGFFVGCGGCFAGLCAVSQIDPDVKRSFNYVGGNAPHVNAASIAVIIPS